MKNLFLIISILSICWFNSHGQNDYRPGLFFREDWKEIPPEIPVGQHHVNHPELLLQVHGTGQDSIKKSNHKQPADDPYYIWSGLCPGNWMVSLKHLNQNVDLTGYAKIKWRTKQSGLRELRIVLKLADGRWLVSNLSDGSGLDWRIKEFNLKDITWHKLDIDRIVESGLAKNVDLSNVEAIGFTDLMPGGNSQACSRLDWIEVYGKSVSRK